jgi:hypothetical protein
MDGDAEAVVEAEGVELGAAEFDGDALEDGLLDGGT